MSLVQKELKIRTRVEGIFNRGEAEFGSKPEYDDYLEQREDIIFNLVEGIDVAETEAKLAAYQRDNFESIVSNEARKAEEARMRAVSLAQQAAPAPLADEGVEPTSSNGQGNILQYDSVLPGMGQMAPSAQAGVPVVLEDSDQQQQQDADAPKDLQKMQLASGWSADFARDRARQQAFGSLWVC